MNADDLMVPMAEQAVKDFRRQITAINTSIADHRAGIKHASRRRRKLERALRHAERIIEKGKP